MLAEGTVLEEVVLFEMSDDVTLAVTEADQSLAVVES
jgi:hypothetical protein